MNKTNGIKLGKLEEKVTNAVLRHSTVMKFKKTIMKFTIALKKIQKVIFVASRAIDIIKGVMGTTFSTAMNSPTYY